MNYTIIIPARLGSTRLARKMLLPLSAGKTVVQHTYEQAIQSSAKRVVIATDHEDIASVARGFGAEVVMTPESCATGTERVAVACEALGLGMDEMIVNLQGDEPLLEPVLFDQVAELLSRSQSRADMATLIEPCVVEAELTSPNTVKVVVNAAGEAIYFSRSLIPYERNSVGITRYKHMGIYAYSVEFLKWLHATPATMLEQTEMLEQLKLLYYGKTIMTECARAPHRRSIDTQEDLDWARAYVSRTVANVPMA